MYVLGRLECQIVQERSYLPESWGKCVEYLKSEWDRKEGRRNKNLKGGKLGARGGSLKKGDWNPLTNYVKLHKYLTFMKLAMCNLASFKHFQD